MDASATDASGADESTVEGSTTAGDSADRGREPPRPPRLRRRRDARGFVSVGAAGAVEDKTGSDAGAVSGFGLDARRDSTTGTSTGASTAGAAGAAGVAAGSSS
jgi:hypothetical protein